MSHFLFRLLSSSAPQWDRAPTTSVVLPNEHEIRRAGNVAGGSLLGLAPATQWPEVTFGGLPTWPLLGVGGQGYFDVVNPSLLLSTGVVVPSTMVSPPPLNALLAAANRRVWQEAAMVARIEQQLILESHRRAEVSAAAAHLSSSIVRPVSAASSSRLLEDDVTRVLSEQPREMQHRHANWS